MAKFPTTLNNWEDRFNNWLDNPDAPAPLVVDLQAFLEECIERYEHDEGCKGLTLVGMYSLAGDILYHYRTRLRSPGEPESVFYAKAQDLLDGRINTLPEGSHEVAERPF